MLNLQNLKPGEEVIKVVRRHWIIYVFLGINMFFAVWVSILTILFIGNNLWCYFLLVIFWLFVSIFMYIRWLDHELDMYVITNSRIIGIEQVWFLNRSLSETNLLQIQDVKSSTKWLLSNIFDFGTLTIQTAWSLTNFEMTFAPNVIQTARVILNIVYDYRDKDSKGNEIL